jgi:euchromatic histone-lysine N-methyltransferase
LGRTPLFIAAQSGNIELCRILIAAGADIDAVDVQGDHCLQASLLSQKWDCASYLLSVVEHYLHDGVADILSSCDYEGLNCLGCCIFLRSVIPSDLSVKFLEFYAGVSLLDAANASGYTPLHLAVSFQSAKWVRVLLELGADPRVSDTIYGWTPTFLA